MFKILCIDDEGLPMLLCTQQIYYNSVLKCVVICGFHSFKYPCTFTRYVKMYTELLTEGYSSICDLGAQLLDIDDEGSGVGQTFSPD